MEKLNGGKQPAIDEETAAALEAAMTTLPPEDFSDFLRLSDIIPERDSGYDPGCIIFNCAIRHGSLVPLKSADRDHPIWRRIIEVANSGISPGTGLLLGSHLVLTMDCGVDHPARIVAIGDDAILAALPRLDPGYSITTAELRILKQLLCGLNLSGAAAQDSVSHETKRTQFKSLCRKLGVRSQNELTSSVLTRILLNLAAGNPQRASRGDRLFVELAHEFVPNARTFLLSGRSGMDHRFIDVGPVCGTPIVFLHSQILPDLRADDVTALSRHGLRLIIPLRNGAMASSFDKLDIDTHLDDLQGQMLAHPKNKWNSSALGRYQIVRTTRRNIQKALSLPATSKFDVEMQDRMACFLLGQRGIDKYLSGRLSEDTLLDNLAREWASLPTSKGKGFYGGQRAAVDPARVRAVLAAVRQRHAQDQPVKEVPVPVEKPVVPPAVEQEVQSKTSWWSWLTGLIGSGGLGLGWLGGMDWQAILAGGAVIVVMLLVILLLRRQIVGAVKEIREGLA